MKKKINLMQLLGLVLAGGGLIAYLVSALLGEQLPMILSTVAIVIGLVISLLYLDDFKDVLDRLKRINNHTILLMITIALFVVLYAAGYFMYGYGDNAKGFEKLQTFLDIFRENAALICITCGMTCVMLTGGIDISVGSVVAMDCMILAVGMEKLAFQIPGAPEWLNTFLASPSFLVPYVLLIGILFGVVQGYLIGYLGIQPFIVTMAGMFFARGMTTMICTEQVSITAKN